MKKCMSAILLSIIVTGASCVGKSHNKTNDMSLFTCEYTALSDDKKELHLSDFVEDCRLVRFDNADSAFFKAWTITATEHHIGIRQSRGSFKLFDKDGKFLCDIGRVGNGPGEYSLSIYDELIDEKGQRIFLAPFVGDKIMLYGIDGRWIKDIKIPQEIGKINKPKIHLNEDGTLSIVHMPMEKTSPLAFCIDMDGKLVKQVLPSEQMIVKDFNGEVFAHHNGDAFEFLHTSTDTLFVYDAITNKVVPGFVMNFPDPDKKPIHIYTSVPQGIFANCYYWDEKANRPGKGGMYFISRQTGKGSQFNIINDFWGNFPAGVMFNHGYYLQCFEPGDLKERLEEYLDSGKCPTKDTEKLTELADSLDENDNNVLFIGKLKQK